MSSVSGKKMNTQGHY